MNMAKFKLTINLDATEEIEIDANTFEEAQRLAIESVEDSGFGFFGKIRDILDIYES